MWYVCCGLSWGYIRALELPYCVMNITLNNNTIQKHFCSTQNPSFDWVPLLENPGWNNVASLACNAPYNTRNPQEYRVSHKKTTIYFKMWFHSGNLDKKKHTFLVTVIKLTVFQCDFFIHNLETMKFENS